MHEGTGAKGGQRGAQPGQWPSPEAANVTTEQWKPLDSEGKKQYDREFLLDFQFMPACIQKPEGLPPISDVVLDKVRSQTAPGRGREGGRVGDGWNTVGKRHVAVTSRPDAMWEGKKGCCRMWALLQGTRGGEGAGRQKVS